MAGGSREHGRLASALTIAIGSALRGRPCAIYSSDVRVHVAATQRTTYPDLTIVCGPVEPAPDDAEAITNPTILVEVLSDSTEAGDRGEKFAHYRHLDSLREYVLVSHKEPRIEVFRREQDGRWRLDDFGPGQTAELQSIDVRVSVDDIYADPTRST